MSILSERVNLRNAKPVTIMFIASIHLCALAAPFTFTWTGLIACLFLYWITGALGVTLCYHRLLTHRSYKTWKPVEYLLTVFAAMALQGGPITWVATHRLHHKESDRFEDPHTPRQGFLWSHMLWTLFKMPNFDSYEDVKHLALDLEKDPVHRFFERFYMVIYVASAFAMFGVGYAIGGVPLAMSLLVWGCFLRTVVVWHSTWLVNSATHVWGYRRYETTDDSRNNWWVALLTFGEGWHNNHHADQRSAAHGHRWYELDLTYWTINMMQFVGVARDVVKPRFKRMAAQAKTSHNEAA